MSTMISHLPAGPEEASPLTMSSREIAELLESAFLFDAEILANILIRNDGVGSDGGDRQHNAQ